VEPTVRFLPTCIFFALFFYSWRLPLGSWYCTYSVPLFFINVSSDKLTFHWICLICIKLLIWRLWKQVRGLEV
jgi:hypothetical protein